MLWTDEKREGFKIICIIKQKKINHEQRTT
jgi:hypothetical protein